MEKIEEAKIEKESERYPMFKISKFDSPRKGKRRRRIRDRSKPRVDSTS